ncbi:hypothetical protein LEP1GSC127_0661 [Leptospira kirschneri str. 200801925]|nr:hypothetical protein LEP1GSC044_0339 [Leptospira kirschneri serovar Grippotyphosa str. RM52]EKP03693.1 hypothetical protein LEP1GSC018_3363 [Leptospira kirschneri str. 2008720114]EKQ85525.1 hypothetical protein LEP1GSC064_0796 [Leptospira kirschneri serovar Grippotyphosa str. Moskva]EKR09300.1 hypothetical protein LEP1GSC122_0063 [Leptospira kirschneri serovar Valbuzzi str. 200702274]EMJ89460.1 hypothetical protein LEP1GSC198_2730 [Leptospira kirschneri str. JB]EMK04273.1 hypothetical prote
MPNLKVSNGSCDFETFLRSDFVLSLSITFAIPKQSLKLGSESKMKFYRF